MTRVRLATLALIIAAAGFAAYYGYGGVANATNSLNDAESDLKQTLEAADETGQEFNQQLSENNARADEIVESVPDVFRPLGTRELDAAVQTAVKHNEAIAKLLVRFEDLVAERNSASERYSKLWLERQRLMLIEKDLLAKLDAASNSMLETHKLRRQDISTFVNGTLGEQSAATGSAAVGAASVSSNLDELSTLVQSYEENHHILETKSQEFVASRNQLAELQLRADDMNALLESQLIHQRRSEDRVQSLRKMQLLFTQAEPTFVAAPPANEQTADNKNSVALRQQISQLRSSALEHVLQQMALLMPKDAPESVEEPAAEAAPTKEKSK